MTLIHILIFLFVCLIGYQIGYQLYLESKPKCLEGLTNNDNSNNSTSSEEYQPYNLKDPNNCLILAQQNAGNINFLKQKVNSIDTGKIKTDFDNLQNQVNTMQGQINSLTQQQSNYAQQIAGSSPPNVTGTNTTDTDTDTDTDTTSS